MNLTLSHSLTHRLTLTYALLVLLLVALSFLSLYWSLRHALATRLDQDLFSDISEFQDMHQTGGLAVVTDEIDAESQGDQHEKEFFVLLDSAGNVVHTSNLSTWPNLVLDGADSLGFDFSQSNSMVVDFSTKESPVHLVFGQLDSNYSLVIAEVAEDNEEILELLFLALFCVFVIALPLVFLLVWILTKRAVSGIHAVSKAADQISAGNLNVRVDARGHVTEVQNLADTFNAMTVRIQQLNTNTREMMDNISHDMRSPLGRIRLFAESLLKENALPNSLRCSAGSTIADCDRLIDMINTSLDVSETEVGVSPIKMGLLDFHSLVADVFELFEPAAKEKGLLYNLSLSDASTILGDPVSLQRMIANLLDNAVKFTPTGGAVSLTMQVVNDYAEVRLTNNGIELSEDMLLRVFDRFYRGDQSRSGEGSGLGLSFAKAVVSSHKGNIRVSSIENEVEFAVQIPLAATASSYGQSANLSPLTT